MTVRLINGREFFKNEITLFGEPFPPDDVKAYWSLVPAEIAVEWSKALSMFFVSVQITADREPSDHPVRRQIMASDAHKLDVWMHVIHELVNGQP